MNNLKVGDIVYFTINNIKHKGKINDGYSENYWIIKSFKDNQSYIIEKYDIKHC